jgi:hypothetical protein
VSFDAGSFDAVSFDAGSFLPVVAIRAHHADARRRPQRRKT